MPAEPAAPSLAGERKVAVEAAEAAGRLLRSRPGWVRAKSARDLLTDLDQRSEDLILGRLRRAYPGDQFVAEESGTHGVDGSRVWFVDPLDGTNNIAIGLPIYAVGIAFCRDRLPVLGVVHDPTTRRTWTATRDGGACGPGLTGLTGGRAPARRYGPPLLAWTQGHAVGRSDGTARAMRGALELRAARLLQLWAPLVAWIMLARGEIDGFVGYRAELVDFPAGALIAMGCGVSLYRLDGGPFDQNIDLPAERRSYIACRPEQLADIMALLEPC